MKQDFLNDITKSFVRIANKIGELNKHHLDFGTGEPLTPAEIHMLAAIETEGNTVTRLGRELGVTKGAVSQLIGRLQQRGYVRKKNGETGRTVLLSLTEKGSAACRGHERLHREMDREMIRVISEYPDEWLTTFRDMLGELERQVDRYCGLGRTAASGEKTRPSSGRG